MCVSISTHYSGVFIARGREDALVTLNMVPGETVYGEKKVSVDTVSFLSHHHCSQHTHARTHTHTSTTHIRVCFGTHTFTNATHIYILTRLQTHTHTHTHTHTQPEGEKTEYRVWNPFRSKLAAAILGGIDKIHIKPGSKVLYLGAASGTTVSHVSDIVGPVSLPGFITSMCNFVFSELVGQTI